MTINPLTFTIQGNLGTNEGANADGVLLGQLTDTNPTKFYLKALAQPCLCITDDGGTYVNETTPANEATADDVEIVGTTIAADDAIYIGHGTLQFGATHIDISTQGAYTDLVGEFQYWDGTAWTALSGVTDGTTGWEAAAGDVPVSFTVPGDWARNTVDSVLGYWIRYNVTSVTSTETPCQIGRIYVVVAAADGVFTEDTTDMTSAGAGDADLLPAFPVVGDGAYFGYGEKFCKLKVKTSQARTGTATFVLKYWDGAAWSAVPIAEDASAGWSAPAGDHILSFEPPSDWTANTAGNGPGGSTGFFVALEMTAMTDVTQQPIATQGWVLPLSTGADGVNAPATGTITKFEMNAGTASAANNDSLFLVLNITTGLWDLASMTAADFVDEDTISLVVTQGDELAVIQVQEDGTTEFAEATFILS